MGDMIYLGGGCGCTFYNGVKTSRDKPQAEPGSTPPVHQPKKLKNQPKRNPGHFETVEYVQSRKDSPMICDLSLKYCDYEVVCVFCITICKWIPAVLRDGHPGGSIVCFRIFCGIFDDFQWFFKFHSARQTVLCPLVMSYSDPFSLLLGLRLSCGARAPTLSGHRRRRRRNLASLVRSSNRNYQEVNVE